jgi:hypothetical protein
VIARKSLLMLAVVAGISPARADEPKAETVKVPFEMLQQGRLISGHLAVQVKVNGKGPYRLVFDTGAPMVLLSSRVGKEAGLIGGDKRPARPAGFGFPGQVRIAKFEVGLLAAEDVSAVVLDHPTIKAIAEAFGPIDGIVGFPFFARYRTAIDYQAKELSFTPNGYMPGDVLQALMATLLDPKRRSKEAQAARILTPAAQWGMRVEKADDDAAGVTIAEVFAGGAAAKAGVKAGDQLLTLDGRWTDSVADCYQAAENAKPGKPVDLLVRRDGKEKKLTVSPAAGF